MGTENPFKPMSGKRPPELIGRDPIIEDFVEGLDNGIGAPGRLMRISGIRGTGKTVLLQELGRIARERGWYIISETASEGLCERIVKRIEDTRTGKSFSLDARLRPSIDVGVASMQLGEAHITAGSADSSTLRSALDRYFEKHKAGLLITIDEVQDAVLDEIRNIAIAFQHAIGDERDIALVFAGLPSMISTIIEGKTLTFLRRALPETLECIDASEVARSFEETFSESGFSTTADLVDALARSTQGYPFMMQLIGYYTWQTAYRRTKQAGGAITELDMERGVATAQERFDATVIEPALQRLSPGLIRYLVAMAQCANERGTKSSDIAQALDMPQTSLSAQRRRLIREDIIESSGYGSVSFVIPHMQDYLIDHAEELLDA